MLDATSIVASFHAQCTPVQCIYNIKYILYAFSDIGFVWYYCIHCKLHFQDVQHQLYNFIIIVSYMHLCSVGTCSICSVSLIFIAS